MLGHATLQPDWAGPSWLVSRARVGPTQGPSRQEWLGPAWAPLGSTPFVIGGGSRNRAELGQARSGPDRGSRNWAELGLARLGPDVHLHSPLLGVLFQGPSRRRALPKHRARAG